MKSAKKVLVFGTFDGIHDGHRFFLNEARKEGDHLTAVVSQDSTTLILKRRAPTHPLMERIETLKKSGLADEVIPADVSIGEWLSIQKVRPDVVCVGYDQINLKSALQKALPKFDWQIEIKTMPSLDGGKIHTSTLPQ